MNQNPLVAVIILNWNGWVDTIQCLESVLSSTYKNYALIVVDNGSKDNSIEHISHWAKESKAGDKDIKIRPSSLKILSGREAEANDPALTPKSLTIIKNAKNYGFARGNNIAFNYVFKEAAPELLLLLNSDTCIARNCMEVLIAAAMSNDCIAAVQPKMLSKNNTDFIDAVGLGPGSLYGGAEQLGFGQKEHPRHNIAGEIFGVCCGAAMFRRKVLTMVGLFDNDFFAYYEDVDLALRVRMAGWKAWYAPEAVVYHAHSSSLGNDSPYKTFLLERNLFFYVVKNLPLKLVIHFLCLHPIVVSKKILKAVKNRQYRYALACVKGNMAALFFLPKLIKKRRSVRAIQQVSNRVVESWFSQ